jgi:hypothetical protein
MQDRKPNKRTEGKKERKGKEDKGEIKIGD